MFSHRFARRRRASGLGSLTEKARSLWSGSNVDRVFGFKRDYARKLGIELLEERRLLAYTATLNFATSIVTFTGNAAAEPLVLGIDGGGNLQHNRFSSGDPGFASDIDLDSTVAGV